jgi:hypothetical protein
MADMVREGRMVCVDTEKRLEEGSGPERFGPSERKCGPKRNAMIELSA